MTSSPTRFISESSRSTLTRMLARADGAPLHAATAGAMASELGRPASAENRLRRRRLLGRHLARRRGNAERRLHEGAGRATAASSPGGRAEATASMRRTASAVAEYRLHRGGREAQPALAHRDEKIFHAVGKVADGTAPDSVGGALEGVERSEQGRHLHVGAGAALEREQRMRDGLEVLDRFRAEVLEDVPIPGVEAHELVEGGPGLSASGSGSEGGTASRPTRSSVIRAAASPTDRARRRGWRALLRRQFSRVLQHRLQLGRFGGQRRKPCSAAAPRSRWVTTNIGSMSPPSRRLPAPSSRVDTVSHASMRKRLSRNSRSGCSVIGSLVSRLRPPA